MNKLNFLVLIVLLTWVLNAHANESFLNSFWVQVIDQNQKAIADATIYYCIFDCILHRNSHNQKQTFTDSNGLAEFKLGNKDELRIQGVVKEGFDIRLKTFPFTEIRLQGENVKATLTNYFVPHRGVYVRYAAGAIPYSIPASEPLFVLTGWKLGPSTCLEQDYKFISHDGRAESKWDIDDAIYYYKVGDDVNNLREGTENDFDFKVTINRSFYPWGNILYRLISSYKIEFEFNKGGAQIITPTSYIHLAPSTGYKEKVVFNYRGIGDISTSHTQRLFINVNERYGALNLKITPSQNVIFDYLLSREINQNQLNVPSHMGELGHASDFFACPGVISTLKQKLITPGSCAKLGLKRLGC